MEEIVKNIGRFWSEAMQNLKKVIEKGDHEVEYLPPREFDLPLTDISCSQDEKPLND